MTDYLEHILQAENNCGDIFKQFIIANVLLQCGLSTYLLYSRKTNDESSGRLMEFIVGSCKSTSLISNKYIFQTTVIFFSTCGLREIVVC